MLLALSVLGGLAMPNNPDAPSYAAGAWHRYFPVQKLSTHPKVQTSMVFPLDVSVFMSGNLSELAVEDKHRIHPDTTGYASIFNYHLNEGTARSGQLRVYTSTSNKGKSVGLDARTSVTDVTVPVYISAPFIASCKAADGLATLNSLPSRRYAGDLASAETRVCSVSLRSALCTHEFYYHHAKKGTWRCDLIALQTPMGNEAVIDVASKQFISTF